MAAIYLESDTCMHQECSFHAQFLYLYRHLIRSNIKFTMLIIHYEKKIFMTKYTVFLATCMSCMDTIDTYYVYFL